MKRAVVATLCAALAVAAASPAFAKPNKEKKNDPPAPQSSNNNSKKSFELGSTLCTLSDISPTASACRGWFEGNLNSGNEDAKAASAAALNDLLGVTTYQGDTLTWLQNIDSLSGPTVDFDQLLYGQTVVAFHVGGAVGAGGVGYQSSAFFVFDAGSSGLDTFTFNLPGLSNARLYSTGRPCVEDCGGGVVPEPGTWALMILGFGGAGAMLRYRRRIAAA